MFHNDARSVGGRDVLVDGMLMHQWRLKHAASTLDTCVGERLETRTERRQPRSEDSTPDRQVLNMRRRVANTTACVDTSDPHPGLSQRMSVNKKCHSNLVAQAHRANLMHMQRRMKAYKPVSVAAWHDRVGDTCTYCF